MAHVERNGKRKTREQLAKRRVPELGYYFIVTDTEETEQNYMYGLRDSIPKELQGKLVIKVIKTKSNNLVEEARNLASINPQYGEIWIIFDRDKVKNFDEIIRQAEDKALTSAGLIHVSRNGSTLTSALCLHIRILSLVATALHRPSKKLLVRNMLSRIRISMRSLIVMETKDRQ